MKANDDFSAEELFFFQVCGRDHEIVFFVDKELIVKKHNVDDFDNITLVDFMKNQNLQHIYSKILEVINSCLSSKGELKETYEEIADTKTSYVVTASFFKQGVICIIDENDNLNLQAKIMRLNEEFLSSNCQPMIIIRGNKIIYFNNAFLKFFGITNFQTKKTPILRFFADRNEGKKIVKEIIANNGGIYDTVLKDEQDVLIFARISTVILNKSSESKEIFVGVSIDDVTKIKLSELKAKEAEEKAVVITGQLKNFLHMVAHDIRNPAGNIMGFAHLMASGSVSPEKFQKYTKFILTSSTYILYLTKTLTLANKIEAGEEISFDMVEINLEEYLESLQEYFKSEVEKRNKKIEFNFNISDKVILSEGDLIRRVIDNVISNSIKFTDKDGLIKLHVTSFNSELKITVEDNGVGIPEDKQAFVFNKNFQGDRSDSRGDGLGLSIVKNIVENIFKGTISFTSIAHKGTTFFIRIPYQLAKIASMTKKDAVLLIVEDDNDAYLMLKSIISPFYREIFRAKEVFQALEIFKTGKIDIVLTDINLKEGAATMGVPGLIKKIKQDNKSLPIVLQTGSSNKAEVDACLAAGANGLISKPYNKEEIFRVLGKF
ncbi:MAG: hybrid sensor histidine kinase/response regulator [Planctomycetes bacterium]|jgi:signal transduction histidine kinase/CheY-like chemotaxis protein|nr:hybrid sensor histidine kinase/response regulator [Planctomycetota bacterium]